MNDERTWYRERTPWPEWARALLWSVVVLVCYPLLAGWDVDLASPLRVLLAGSVVGFALLLRTLMGGMTVLVQETRLLIHMGSTELVRKIVLYSEVASMEAVTYRPIMEFGGWGIRGFGKKRAWTARGNRALVLGLTGGRQLYVGTDHPQRLAERIRAAAGERLADARLDPASEGSERREGWGGRSEHSDRSRSERSEW